MIKSKILKINRQNILNIKHQLLLEFKVLTTILLKRIYHMGK